MNEAYEKALSYLSLKSRSKKQVENYLSKCGFADNEICICMEKLEEYKFIDDEEYADILLYKLKSKDYSLAMAEAYLRKEGIDQLYIEQIINALGFDYEQKSLNNFFIKELKNKKINEMIINKVKNKALRKGFMDYNIEDILLDIKNNLTEEDY